MTNVNTEDDIYSEEREGGATCTGARILHKICSVEECTNYDDEGKGIDIKTVFEHKNLKQFRTINILKIYRLLKHYRHKGTFYDISFNNNYFCSKHINEILKILKLENDYFASYNKRESLKCIFPGCKYFHNNKKSIKEYGETIYICSDHDKILRNLFDYYMPTLSVNLLGYMLTGAYYWDERFLSDKLKWELEFYRKQQHSIRQQSDTNEEFHSDSLFIIKCRG